MSKAPWIRWFASNWIAATAHLGPLEEGVYSKLIQHYYQSRRPLPADFDKLCMIARATEPSSRRAVEEVVSEYFYPAEDAEYGEVLRHHRADEEISYSDRKHGDAVTKGLKTAWTRYGDESAKTMLEALGIDVPYRNQPKSSSTGSSTGSSTTPQLPENQNQNQNQNKEGDKPPKPPFTKTRPDDVIPGGIDPQAWADFTAHRREIRKPLTDLSARKNAETLRTLSPAQQREAVNASIANRWTGVFPPKDKTGNGSTKTVSHEVFREMISRGEL